MSAYVLVVLHSTLFIWPFCNSDVNSNHRGLAIDTSHMPTKDACASVFKSGIRQGRYKLKQKYFVGVPANEIATTSHVPYMTDAQWCQLVEKWSNAHNKVISFAVLSNMYL